MMSLKITQDNFVRRNNINIIPLNVGDIHEIYKYACVNLVSVLIICQQVKNLIFFIEKEPCSCANLWFQFYNLNASNFCVCKSAPGILLDPTPGCWTMIS